MGPAAYGKIGMIIKLDVVVQTYCNHKATFLILLSLLLPFTGRYFSLNFQVIDFKLGTMILRYSDTTVNIFFTDPDNGSIQDFINPLCASMSVQ